MSNLDASFSALADPTRRAILARLALGEATVGERLVRSLAQEVGDPTGRGEPFVAIQDVRKSFHGKPVLFAPVYFTCPMLCSQILRGVVAGLRPLSLEPGRDFEIDPVNHGTTTVNLHQLIGEKNVLSLGRVR